MKMAAGHLRLTDSPSPKRAIDFDKIRFNLHLSLGKGKRVRRTPPRGSGNDAEALIALAGLSPDGWDNPSRPAE